ncbi:MAG: hypothetical protein KDB53_12405, partial [Planctomycetes bacterium]|nr:hypothetical protein [Planctomycetota bacterium]
HLDAAREVFAAAWRSMVRETSPPTTTHLLLQRAFLTVGGLLVSAAEPLESLLAGAPEVPADRAEIFVRRGQELAVFIATGNDEAARELLREAIAGDLGALVRHGALLARLLAETGTFDQAIEIMTRVESQRPLDGDEIERLGAWNLALGRMEAARSRQRQALDAQSEWELRDRIYAVARRFENPGPEGPGELEPWVLDALQSLFRRAQQPQNHADLLRQLRRATRDFRLLGVLVDGLTGQTPEHLYALLGSFRWVVEDLDDEASLDRLGREIDRVRAGVTSAADGRALTLLEYLSYRRALTLDHGTEDSLRRAIDALERSMKSEWMPGERGLYAHFLGDMQRQPRPEFARRVIEQVGRLRGDLERGTDEFFDVASQLAWIAWWNSEFDLAIRSLNTALAADREAHDGLHASTNQWWRQTLREWYEKRSRFVDAESFFLDELARPYPESHLHWLYQQLVYVRLEALRRGGRTSLGDGASLYRAGSDEVLRRITSESRTDRLHDLVALVVGYHEAGTKAKLDAEVNKDVLTFAHIDLPAILSRTHHEDWATPVIAVADDLWTRTTRTAAVEFLVGRGETTPPNVEALGQGFWSRAGNQLAWYRHAAGPIVDGSLDRRLETLVIAGLTQDLVSGRQDLSSFTQVSNSYFWRSRQEAFRDCALKVAREHADDRRIIDRVARYLAHGLDEKGLAIELLTTFHERFGLNKASRLQLANWLRDASRYAEALPHVEAMLDDEPRDLDLWTLKVRLLDDLNRRDDLAAAFAAAEETLLSERDDRESMIAHFANLAAVTGQDERAVRLFEEAIGLHVRRAPNRGNGDGVLAEYYRQHALALARLGRSLEAVDAAAGSIVAWGSSREARGRVLGTLEEVLRLTQDLGPIMERLESEVARSGLENPILRRALGRVFAERKQYDEAAAALRRALEAAPEDLSIHDDLVAALEDGGQADAALEARRERAWARGRDAEAWRDLAQRLHQAGRETEAECTITQAVEASPEEAPGHTALAEYRAEHEQWLDAAAAWAEVAAIRALEPTGMLGQAEALMKAGRADDAARLVKELRSKVWPERFTDTENRLRALEKALNR